VEKLLVDMSLNKQNNIGNTAPRRQERATIVSSYRPGDMVIYTDDIDARIGQKGIVISVRDNWYSIDSPSEPEVLEILWTDGSIESVYGDEVEVIYEAR